MRKNDDQGNEAYFKILDLPGMAVPLPSDVLPIEDMNSAAEQNQRGSSTTAVP